VGDRGREKRTVAIAFVHTVSFLLCLRSSGSAGLAMFLQIAYSQCLAACFLFSPAHRVYPVRLGIARVSCADIGRLCFKIDTAYRQYRPQSHIGPSILYSDGEPDTVLYKYRTKFLYRPKTKS